MATLEAWVNAWIERRSIRLAPSTISGYRGNLRRYITPSEVGQMQIDQIDADDLIVLLSSIVGKGFTRQAQLVQILIGAALKDAVKRRIIPWNPMDCVDKIKHHSNRTPWLTADEAAQLLKSARDHGDPFYLAWLLALNCGLRRGELLGLKWTDIDFDHKVLHVRRQLIRIDGHVIETAPKTETSIRDIPLPDVVADRLRFARSDGRVIAGTAEDLRRGLDRAIRRANVPRVTLHGLRHTMAATAATIGIPIKVLQLLMGHAQYSTTADIYAHIDRKTINIASASIAARLEIA